MICPRCDAKGFGKVKPTACRRCGSIRLHLERKLIPWKAEPPMNLKTELEAVGWKKGCDKFRELVMSEFAKKFGDRTDEELLVNPQDAMKFCGFVRKRGNVDVRDEVILRTLTNCRKKGPEAV